jgi:hypothetical protein
VISYEDAIKARRKPMEHKQRPLQSQPSADVHKTLYQTAEETSYAASDFDYTQPLSRTSYKQKVNVDKISEIRPDKHRPAGYAGSKVVSTQCLSL